MSERLAEFFAGLVNAFAVMNNTGVILTGQGKKRIAEALQLGKFDEVECWIAHNLIKEDDNGTEN